MDWIHCNRCFIQPRKNSQRKFCLTSCGHIYCDACEKEATLDSCHMCKTKCTTIQLQSKMQPEVQMFFTDPDELVKNLGQVITFQKSHRTKLMDVQQKIGEKYQIAKLYIKRLEDERKTMKRELEYYKKHLFSDTSQLDGMEFITPGSNCTPTSAYTARVDSNLNSVRSTIGPSSGFGNRFGTNDNPNFSNPNYRSCAAVSPASSRGGREDQRTLRAHSSQSNAGRTPPYGAYKNYALSNRFTHFK